MMKQISGSTSPDTTTDQIFPTFYPSFNPQNDIINSIIIFLYEQCCIGNCLIILGRTWFQIHFMYFSIIAYALYPKY